MPRPPSGLTFLWPALFLTGAAPADPERPQEITFAERAFGGWSAEAVTRIEYEVDGNGKGPFPYVQDVACQVQRNGMAVSLDRKGRYGIRLAGGNPNADEENSGFSTPNVRSIRVDRIPYEAKGVQTLFVRKKFGDVQYPPVEGDDVILPVFGGYVAVRRDPGEPWLEITALLPDLIRGRSLRIGHGHEVDGRVPLIHHLTVPLAGLGPALKWCETQVRSEAAYRFHAR